MKIQCDVCGGEEASVFCCADEAALCDPCDRRVHRANKLAGKHRRFSLLRPTSLDLAPRCDICQDKRAFVFCQEDRAILCKDCDGQIHSANELTMKHNRFLLTGVKISPTPPADDVGAAAAAEDEMEKNKKKKVVPQTADPVKGGSQSFRSSCKSALTNDKEATVMPEVESTGGGSSSISDYLMKTLPGWRVDDLLLDYPSFTSASLPPFASASTLASPVLCEVGIGGEDSLSFMATDLDSGLSGGGDAPVWWDPRFPQVPSKTATVSNTATSTGLPRRRTDDSFTVPQIISQPPPPQSMKRSRSMWYA